MQCIWQTVKVWSGYSGQLMYICAVVHCAQHRVISTTGAFICTLYVICYCQLHGMHMEVSSWLTLQYSVSQMNVNIVLKWSNVDCSCWWRIMQCCLRASIQWHMNIYSWHARNIVVPLVSYSVFQALVYGRATSCLVRVFSYSDMQAVCS